VAEQTNAQTPSERAVLHRNVALVEFDNEARAQEILDVSGFGGFVIRRLTPTAFLVDPNKATVLSERLRELGFPPNVQGGD